MPKKTFVAGTVLRAADTNEYLTSSKNVILNGDFSINQRAFTSTSTGGTYGLDRWRLLSSSGCTYSVQSFVAGAAPVAGYEAINYARLVTSGQSGTSVYSILSQPIEDVRTLSGQTAVVSFWAKAASGTPSIAVDLTQAFGSGGSPSATVYTPAGKVTLSTAWARYSVSVNVPSISGKTVGTTANTSYLEVDLWVSAGTDFNTRASSIGIQTNTFDIWGVQVEEGSVATPFSRATPTIASELASCQRYYYRNTATEFSPLTVSAFGNNAANGFNAVAIFPTRMRIAPASVETNNTAILIPGVNYFAATSISIDRSSTDGAVLNGSCSGMTTGRAYVYVSSVGGGGYVGFSAEL